jgi:nitrate/TMAO reductase-like tetraheme cytochrome c subunit
MSNPVNPSPRKSLIFRTWLFLTRPSSRFSLATLLIVGGIGGVIFWGGFNWAMELANTEAFCISCHEMRDNPYKELQQTIHFKNRSGVRPICSDCHVPKEWFYKIRRKIQASNELLHKILGTINTPEKFEQHRLELAQHVWATMKANDSHECRNCHSAGSMDPHKQSEAAQKVMAEGFKAGLTCIDCHKGIAHHLPKFPDEDEDESKKK